MPNLLLDLPHDLQTLVWKYVYAEVVKELDKEFNMIHFIDGDLDLPILPFYEFLRDCRIELKMRGLIESDSDEDL